MSSITASQKQNLKPPLKWAGGKRWLVSDLQPLWQPFRERRYVEPFCGGLAVALGLQPTVALLNDINPHLINFYRQVQKGLELKLEMRNDETLFYQHRRRFNELVGTQARSAEAAQLFYYLNRTCFNGLCRFNQSGEFNVPFGTYTAINYVTHFHDYVPIMSAWTFSNCDIEKLGIQAEDFVYADPPYDVEFTSYSAGGFSWTDQVRTAEFLSRHPGPVVISNQATPRIIDLYNNLGFRLEYLAAPRRISCTGDRSAAREVLALKNLAN
ncbi:MAG TPA: Dam family site-specific DNA-(adenine-N6)-methyltransferase [Pyrinomonadaceae bacterium]|nr:Dam family site-specific DNA-(adenine-N6)-methyltransferase [Pyrinomonadaceae bacterium]